jgi:hypothetical protein
VPLGPQQCWSYGWLQPKACLRPFTNRIYEYIPPPCLQEPVPPIVVCPMRVDYQLALLPIDPHDAVEPTVRGMQCLLTGIHTCSMICSTFQRRNFVRITECKQHRLLPSALLPVTGFKSRSFAAFAAAASGAKTLGESALLKYGGYYYIYLLTFPLDCRGCMQPCTATHVSSPVSSLSCKAWLV